MKANKTVYDNNIVQLPANQAQGKSYFIFRDALGNEVRFANTPNGAHIKVFVKKGVEYATTENMFLGDEQYMTIGRVVPPGAGWRMLGQKKLKTTWTRPYRYADVFHWTDLGEDHLVHQDFMGQGFANEE